MVFRTLENFFFAAQFFAPIFIFNLLNTYWTVLSPTLFNIIAFREILSGNMKKKMSKTFYDEKVYEETRMMKIDTWR